MLTDRNQRRIQYTTSLILLLASISWFSGAYFGVSEDFSAKDILFIAGAFALALMLEIAFIFLLHRSIGSGVLTTAVAAVFALINLVSLNLIMMEDFVSLDGRLKAATMLVLLAVMYAVLTLCQSSGIVRRVAIGLLCVSAMIPALSWLFAAKQEMPVPAAVYDQMKFLERPNVYFIGFESMAAPPVLAKYLDYQESPLPDAFARNDFRMFRNLFSEAAPTVPSLRSLLAVDPEFRASALALRAPLMRGDLPSPLLKVFKSNGYETTTAYFNSYFGAFKGPYVDNYMYKDVFSVCSFLARKESHLAFFGVCNLYGTALWPRWGEMSREEFYRKLIAEVSSKASPQFLFIHKPPLAHTSKEFKGTPQQLEAFKAFYHRMGLAAAKSLDGIMKIIRANDPRGIVFVFGDHGALISIRRPLEGDRAFKVQDRFAILGGISPKDACRQWFDAPRESSFITTVEVTRILLKCLTGGVDAFAPDHRHGAQDGLENVDLEAFLYE